MINKNPDPSTNPQPLFTAEESNWQDLSRMAAFIATLGFGFVIATIYLVFFLIYISNKLSLTNPSKFVGIMIIVAVFIVLIVPIVLEFIGLRIISGFSKNFTKSFYNIPDEINVASLIQRRVFGVPPMPKSLSMVITYPFILVMGDKLDDKFSWAYSLGGPAKLIIYDGYAVYLERGGKFSRVVGSGIAFLERYETVRDIIDLHPQIKELPIDCWTKDGIKLKVHVRLEYQILSAENSATPQAEAAPESEKRVYPFYAKAVQKAVETASVAVWLGNVGNDGKPEKYDWVAGVYGNVEGHIRTHIRSNTINDLLRADAAGQTELLLSPEFNELLYEMVNKGIEDNPGIVERLGARLINLQILKVEKDDLIDDQWRKNWSAEWKSLNTITAGEAEAYKIRTIEKAHAEAQKDMILAIAGSLENMNEQEMREPLLLSLSGMLENSLVDPYVRAALPKETLETLEKLQDYLQPKE
jgi:hypothetical protein